MGAVVVVAALTGWPVAAVLAGLGAWALPSVLGGAKERAREVARTEAIAGWAEMLRDTLSAAAGLEQAIVATASVAPLPIRDEVVALAGRLEAERLVPALRRFADDLADPTGDLVVAASGAGRRPRGPTALRTLGFLGRRRSGSSGDAATDRGRSGAHPHLDQGGGRVHARLRGWADRAQPLLPRTLLHPARSSRPRRHRTDIWAGVLVAGSDGTTQCARALSGLAHPHRPGVGSDVMTMALVCGAGIGLGLLLVVRGLFPPQVPLAVAFDRLHGANQRGVGPDGVGHDRGHLGDLYPQASDAGFAARIGRPLARHLVTLPLLSRRVRSDLAVLGRSPEQHLAERVTLALFGFLIVPAFAGVLLLGGADLGWTLPLWAAIVLAAGGFFAPDLGLHSEAATRRADFRHALGSFLDLVVISLAGGAGVEGALSEAAAIGHGWAFARLRRALDESRLTRTAPWGPLGRLGEALGCGRTE